MKQYSIIIALLLVFSSSLCFAQTSQPTITDDFKPSTVNQPGKEYPQVNSQGYARFRIETPQAQSVVVSLGLGGTKGGTPLTKAEDGPGLALPQDQWKKASITTLLQLTVVYLTIPEL